MSGRYSFRERSSIKKKRRSDFGYESTGASSRSPSVPEPVGNEWSPTNDPSVDEVVNKDNVGLEKEVNDLEAEYEAREREAGAEAGRSLETNHVTRPTMICLIEEVGVEVGPPEDRGNPVATLLGDLQRAKTRTPRCISNSAGNVSHK